MQERTKGAYEIHLATNPITLQQTREVFSQLELAGITKHKFFLSVHDLEPYTIDGSFSFDGSAPRGHDLKKPYSMSSKIVGSFDEARKLVIAGLKIIKEHGKGGNFEIEKIISDSVMDHPEIDLSQFEQIREVPHSPKYENHLVWKVQRHLKSTGPLALLINEQTGVLPHQVVQFAREPYFDSSPVTVVATVYHPDRKSALEASNIFYKHQNSLMGCYFVTEQVCLVGEMQK